MDAYKVNEANLQSYRLFCLVAQSALLIADVMLLGLTPFIAMLLSIAGVLFIWLIWSPVVVARQRVVDFHKKQAEGYLLPDGVCSLKDYVENTDGKRDLVNRKYFGGTVNWRTTRIKIDRWTPILFTGIWIILFYVGLARLF
jgi:hypothetical protein